MAPGRRRASARAAAAAAARQQWKVGDLVLAKMKGFPAWPAMISDPKKWGYSSDRKKFLVFFYGTKQIAFCKHTDLEAFTEEKKKYLLTKRQGKGADFVRAVDEIVDIYEKQKKGDQLENNTEDKGPVAEGVILDDFRSNTFLKAPELHSDIICDQQSESLNASVENNNTSIPDDVPAGLENGVFCKTNTDAKEEPTEKISILDQLRQTPLAGITTVRKRQRDTSLQCSVVQKRVPTLRRCRSSSGVDSGKTHSTTQSAGGDDGPTSGVVPEVSASVKSLVGEVQEISAPHSVNQVSSVGLGSLDSCKDDDSDLVKVESEFIHCKEEGMLEPNFKSSHFENGFLDKDGSLNPEMDASIKSIVLKKRRKPIRKRVNIDSESAPFCSNGDLQIEEEAVPESLNSSKEVNEKFHKTDGDEHLPLVKRARVRKGEPHVDETQYNTEKSEKVPVLNKSDENAMSGSPCRTCPEVSVCSSSLNNCISDTGNGVKIWKPEYQLRSISADVEAALPPSKRIHRALEAMSANADESNVDGGHASRLTEFSSNDGEGSPNANSCHISTNGDIVSSLESPNVHCSEKTSSPHRVSELQSNVTTKLLDASLIISSEVNLDVDQNGKFESSHNSATEGTLMDIDNCDGLSLHKTTQVGILEETLQLGAFRSEREVHSIPEQIVVVQMSPCVEGGTKNEIYSKESCAYAEVDVRAGKNGTLGLVPEKIGSEMASDISPLDEAGMVLSIGDEVSKPSIVSGIMNSAIPLPNDITGDRDIQGPVTEIKQKATSKDRGFSLDLAPMKVLIAAAQAKRLLSRSTSFSDSVDDIKVLPHTLVNYQEDSSEAGSPSIPLAVHGASEDMTQGYDSRTSNSKSSPNQKGSNIPTGHAEADVALRTFEASLHMLSRTKESIGRATRLAIECAKHGVAGEVIELLVLNLEREPSLYRRVDLFFLVDSITQFSRIQKASAGDVYPLLVQSVLTRLMCAAAPPGKSAFENRRQCLKVLRIWLERKTLPESIVRHHIRELDLVNAAPFASHSSWRPRTERAHNDPVREMEGMLVDEYGSNTNFQLSSLLVPCAVENDEQDSSSAEKSFEAVTPERNAEVGDGSGTMNSVEKHRRILEDVDGELEMEDVSPPCGVQICSSHVAGPECVCSADNNGQQHLTLFVPPLPEDLPPSPPPLPSSPPPLASPSSSSSAQQHTSMDSCQAIVTADSNVYSATHSIRNHVSQSVSINPGKMTLGAVPSASMQYARHYGDIRRQMPEPYSTFGCSSSCRSFPNTQPPMHSTNKTLPPVNPPLANNAYSLQPPPPRVSDHFSFAHSEPQQRTQAWKNCSPVPVNLRPVHDSRGGKFYNGQDFFQHDINERGRPYTTVYSGPILSEKVELSTTAHSFYRPPPELSAHLSYGWQCPPRISNYHPVSAPRPHMDNPVSRVDGVHNFWRPR